jgi:SAM-dependent methyltransferase
MAHPSERSGAGERHNPAADYQRIGIGYAAKRQTDPRLAAAIWAALGDAQSVVNVGAGTGSYEPPDRDVVAVEPSSVMLAQRPAEAAPAIQASAERLPFDDDSFDAALAVLTDHHWRDRDRALRELRRVARDRVVLVNADPPQAGRFWLTTEYLPGFLELIPAPYQRPGAWEADFAQTLGANLRFDKLLIPHDCQDGFYGAFWRRPHAYLDDQVRGAISVFARLDKSEIANAVNTLQSDLDSGAWQRRHEDLENLDALDLGYFVITAT